MAKVEDVEIYLIELPKKPGTADYRILIAVVRDSDGVTGVGEVGLVYGDGASAAARMLAELSANYLVGHNADEITAFWHRAYRNAFWSHCGGQVWFGALSALDQALWDIRGKTLGQPVHSLLGGPVHSKLRLYCNGWTRNCGHADEYASAAAAVVEEGYSALKFDPYKYLENGQLRPLDGRISKSFHRIAMDRVRAVREAIGPDIEIIIELHANLTSLQALRACRDVESYDPWYVEEPIDCTNAASFAAFERRVSVPLSTGERICGLQKFTPYLASGSLSVIQPDIGLCGGLTEGMRICALAAAHGVDVQPHNCGGPISTAACVQLSFATPNFLVQEIFPSFKDGRYDLVTNPFEGRVTEGYLDLPTDPGLGVELNMDYLRGHAVDKVCA